ncbi:MAG: hypothetical protein HY906_03960 [Deltaproteobacteria bacterium]|nr:hypothetical protein [Deltaproteobacteria bacterium]
MSDDTLALPLDPRLMEQFEKSARAKGLDVKTALAHAIANWSAPRCPTCGRGSDAPTAPAGFTEAFASFITECTAGQGFWPAVTLTTLEAGRQKAYWVRIRGDAPHEGMLMVYVLIGTELGGPELPAAIPRGVITGWRQDPSGRWYGMCHALGYLDGNAPARQVAAMMRQQGEL